MNITDLPAYQTKPRQPREEKPAEPVMTRIIGETEIIVGTVRELRGQMFRLWDDAACRYFRATDEQVTMLQAALDKNYKTKVTIEQQKQVKVIEIL